MLRELDKPPILMGHSAGGAFMQIVMDHGFGAAGVAINSAPTEGVPVVPLAQVKATFPVLKSPANHHKAVGYTFEQWQYAFTNTFTEEEGRRLYERYHVPASGRILWDSVLANLQPGHQGTWVDYKNDSRAPLLFLSGSEDHLMPPAIQKSNAKHYKSNTITELKEYAGKAHLMPSQEGWEEIADYALDWAVEHAQGQADRVRQRLDRGPGCKGSASPTSVGRPCSSSSADGGCSPTRPSTRRADGTASAGERRRTS